MTCIVSQMTSRSLSRSGIMRTPVCRDTTRYIEALHLLRLPRWLFIGAGIHIETDKISLSRVVWSVRYRAWSPITHCIEYRFINNNVFRPLSVDVRQSSRRIKYLPDPADFRHSRLSITRGLIIERELRVNNYAKRRLAVLRTDVDVTMARPGAFWWRNPNLRFLKPRHV